MKKFTWGAVLSLFVVMSAFAQNGLMAGEKNIKYVSTKYFDVIYSEASKESAAELVQQADAILEDICADLGIAPGVGESHMPVVISPATDLFNAYYTNYTYNHIVLYDAVPEDDMAVNNNTIVETFKHELTHAVTINMRNGFWKGVDSFFGDVVNWGDYVVMPSLIKEGASVAYESKTGMGRLHDEYYLQQVKQAKIERVFPSWADVTGATDVYPLGNTAYGFGGPFTEWLQKTYGMERYARYWYNAVNMNALTFATSFKKAFGVSLDTAWRFFEASISVPDVASDPLTEDGISDFFMFGKDGQNTPDGKPIHSLQNSRGSLYASVTESDRGIAFVDENTAAVYYAKKNEDGTFEQAYKLFSKRNISRISLSKDGAFMAVSSYSINHPTVKNEVSIYNMETGIFFTLSDTGLRDASIICNDGKYFLAAVKTSSQQVSLVTYALLTAVPVRGVQKTSITNASLLRAVDFVRGDSVYSVGDGGKGSVVCIYKNNMTWTVRFFAGMCTADGPLAQTVFTLPKKDMRLRNVSLVYEKRAEEDGPARTFAFSWTAPGTMPRLGYLLLNDTDGSDALFEFMQRDISGGVYFPAAYRCADSNRGQLPSVAYVGYFYKDKKLLVMNSAQFEFEEVTAASETAAVAEPSDLIPFDESVLASAKPYTKLYNNKGVILPWTGISQYNNVLSQTAAILFPGVTWITSNPWDADSFAVSGGYDLFTNTAGLLVTLSGESNTSVLSYVEQPDVTFDGDGFKQFVNYAGVQTGFMLDNVTSFVASDQTLLLVGRQHVVKTDSSNSLIAAVSTHSNLFETLCGMTKTTDSTQYLSALNQMACQISNIHQCGPGTYEKGGVKVSAVYQVLFANTLAKGVVNGNVYQNVYPTFTFQVPHLVPVNCYYGYTYNLPVVAAVSFFPSMIQFMNAQVEMVVFSKEIQKGLSYWPVFVNRFTATLGYTIDLYNQNGNFEIINFVEDVKHIDKMLMNDSIDAKFMLDAADNTGAFASSGAVQHIGIELQYYPHAGETVDMFKISLTNTLMF